MHTSEQDLYDLGLQADLAMMQQTVISRRCLLRLGLIGITTFLTSCGAPVTETSLTTRPANPPSPPAPTSIARTECVDAIPRETAGPFPGNGSQGPELNILNRSGVVRTDIRTSLGTGNTATGVPLRLELKLVRAGDDCAPLPGYTIYLWHCDAPGRYSMYSPGVEGEDYLRGVQAADEQGLIVFETIVPGCYPGRWPHMHFEVYPALDLTTSSSNVIHTSQLALPADICQQVYTDPRYGNSLRNLGRLAIERDSIFRDGWEAQMATVTGSPNAGLVARLTVGVPGV